MERFAMKNFNTLIKLSALMTLVFMLVIAGCSSDSNNVLNPNTDSASLSAVSGSISDHDDDKDNDYDEMEAKGYVEMINYTNWQFQLMGQYFYADENTEISIKDCSEPYPSFEDIRDGDYVKVEYTGEETDMGYYLSEIRVERNYDVMSAEGYVTMVDADGMIFQVGEQYFWVDNCTGFDIESCSYQYPGLSELASGDYVMVQYDNNMGDDGYYALEVEVKRDFEYTETRGTVENIDYQNQTITVMGQTFWFNDCTKFSTEEDDDYSGIDQVYVGDYVKVEHRTDMDDAGYYAVSIKVDYDEDYNDDDYDNDYDDDYEIKGYVEAIDYGNMTITVLGVSYMADEHTKIEIDHCYNEFPTFDMINTGDYVKIEYQTDSTGNYARKIEVKSEYDYYEITGTIDAIDYDNLTVEIAGNTYWFNDCTEFDLEGYSGFEMLEMGDMVEVKYRSEMDETGYYGRKIKLVGEKHYSAD